MLTVVNRNLVRFLELVSPPALEQTSSLIWSAKEEGVAGGEILRRTLRRYVTAFVPSDIVHGGKPKVSFAAAGRLPRQFHELNRPDGRLRP